MSECLLAMLFIAVTWHLSNLRESLDKSIEMNAQHYERTMVVLNRMRGTLDRSLAFQEVTAKADGVSLDVPECCNYRDDACPETDVTCK